MRAPLALLLAAFALAAAVGARANIAHDDLSFVDLSMAMPADLPEGTTEGMSAQAVAELHAAAGSVADEAIAEAKRQSMLMETDSIIALGAKKWDDSVPEVHLKTATRPEDTLSTELETVDHLDHARATLTKEDLTAPQSLMAAFPHSSPAILGEDHSFIQNQAQQNAQQAQQIQVVVVADTKAEAETAAEGSSETEADTDAAVLTDAEVAAGVVTMSDLAQMMELQGFTQQEIDQYMENLSQQTVDAATEADAETEAEAETEGGAEAETEAEADTETEVAADAEQQVDQEVDHAVDAEMEAAATAETETEAETEAETETATDASTDADAEVDASAESVAAAESEQAFESGQEAAVETAPTPAPTEAELAAYAQDSAESGIPATELLEIEHQAQAEEEARLAAEQAEQAAAEPQADAALVEQNAEFEADADADAESEQTMASDMDAFAAGEAEAEAEAQEPQLEQPLLAQQDEEVVHLRDHAQPAVLAEAVPGSVTPMHSRAYRRRHPTLQRVAIAARAQGPSGYSLPQPTAMVETRSSSRAQQRTRSYQRSASSDLDTSKFNPSAVQLGPSKDAYGYVPMTGAEFLNSPQQPASLAQVSMQLQNQGASWLPPPVEAQAVPNYVVGIGGLMPNRNAGPYQGQYAMAAGEQPLPEQPAFIQY